MFTIKNYVRAQSLEEAWTLNQKRSSRILGGMLWLKMGRGTVQTAIDLSGLGLDTIEETEDGFSIGAMVTLRQLEQHPGLNQYTQNAVQSRILWGCSSAILPPWAAACGGASVSPMC